jgi:hypothetical protein
LYKNDVTEEDFENIVEHRQWLETLILDADAINSNKIIPKTLDTQKTTQQTKKANKLIPDQIRS